MKIVTLFITLFLTSCSSLGFGEFDDKKIIQNNSSNGEIPITFTYQPLIGGKHRVYIAGDFNNWSETSTLMEEVDGIYQKTLDLKTGKYGYKVIIGARNGVCAIWEYDLNFFLMENISFQLSIDSELELFRPEIEYAVNFLTKSHFLVCRKTSEKIIWKRFVSIFFLFFWNFLFENREILISSLK